MCHIMHAASTIKLNVTFCNYRTFLVAYTTRKHTHSAILVIKCVCASLARHIHLAIITTFGNGTNR